MMRGVMAAALCLLLLAFAHQGEAARLGGTMVEHEDQTTATTTIRAGSLAEESKVAQARYEAGDFSCGRFGYHNRCFDTPPSAHMGTTTAGDGDSMYSSELVAKARALNGDPSCGRYEYHWRCFDVPSSGHTPATTEETILGTPDFGDRADRFDCGPLGKHKYRCGDIPPATTSQLTEPETTLRPDRSDCGPLGKHKYRCVPPHRKL